MYSDTKTKVMSPDGEKDCNSVAQERNYDAINVAEKVEICADENKKRDDLDTDEELSNQL